MQVNLAKTNTQNVVTLLLVALLKEFIMQIRTLSSREFNQDISSAKRAATQAPVIITDRGKPSHVLLSINEYQKITGQQKSIVELLSISEDIDFEPGKMTDMPFKTADLS
jgi:prevent-host-death family protein